MDEETGLYYYGARYLDAKYSRWLSADPALKDYIPQAGGDNARLPNGGMYNYTNLSLYHYSNNNPIKYTDPDGRSGKLSIYSQRGTNNLLPQRIDENSVQKQSSWIYGNHSWISFTDAETGETTYYGTWGHDIGGNFGLRINDSSEKHQSEANQNGIDLDIETRTRQLDDKQQKKLEKYISKVKKRGNKAWGMWYPCSNFAAKLWKKITKEKLKDRHLFGFGYSDPNVLADSIKKKNEAEKRKQEKNIQTEIKKEVE